MGKYADIDAIKNYYHRLETELPKLVQEGLNKRIEPTKKNIYSDFGVLEDSYVRGVFEESVVEFYSAYSPSEYQRTYGLFDVLDIKKDEFGMVIGEPPNYDELYDGTKMHPNRSGGATLFKDVFQEGWHGGARSISSGKASVWGAHPSPGTPYYRRPGRAWGGRGFWHKYGKWGRQASQTESAYHLISKKIDEAYAPDGRMIRTLQDLAVLQIGEMADRFVTEEVPRILESLK